MAYRIEQDRFSPDLMSLRVVRIARVASNRGDIGLVAREMAIIQNDCSTNAVSVPERSTHPDLWVKGKQFAARKGAKKLWQQRLRMEAQM